MKKRRNFVVAILLVAIMCIGVGYAALTSTISGEGTITYTPAFDIQWTETVTGATDVNVSTNTHTNDTLTFTVDTSSMAVNDTTTVTATVKNNSKYAAENVTVTPATATATSDNCYTVVAVPSATTIAADGGETIVTFTITLTAYPQADDDYNVTFKFSVTAEQDIA